MKKGYSPFQVSLSIYAADAIIIPRTLSLSHVLHDITPACNNRLLWKPPWRKGIPRFKIHFRCSPRSTGWKVDQASWYDNVELHMQCTFFVMVSFKHPPGKHPISSSGAADIVTQPCADIIVLAIPKHNILSTLPY